MQEGLIDRIVNAICSNLHCIKTEVSKDKRGVDVSIDEERVRFLVENVFFANQELVLLGGALLE